MRRSDQRRSDGQKRASRRAAFRSSRRRVAVISKRRARYEALAAATPRDPLAALVRPNAATAALDRFVAAYEARDWAAVRALAADGARFEDRRRHALLSMDIDEEVADLARAAGEEDSHYARTLVATAGDRIALRLLRHATQSFLHGQCMGRFGVGHRAVAAA